MNNKWIVPIVAILLCAVSLIGAGYAALSATLTDTETTTVDNDYLKLTLNDTQTKDLEFDFEWDQNIVYDEGDFKSVVYTIQDSTDKMFQFQVKKDASYLLSNNDLTTGATDNDDGYNLDGKDKDTNTFKLTIASVVIKQITGTAMDIGGTITLAIFDSAGEVARDTAGNVTIGGATVTGYEFTNLSYDTTYTVKLIYDADDESPFAKKYSSAAETPAGYEQATTAADAFDKFEDAVPGSISFTLQAEADVVETNTPTDHCTISFNANGGTGEIANQIITVGQEAALTENAFARDGYTFVGWATTPGGSKVFDDEDDFTAYAAMNVTLYAVWTANQYTVTFSAGDGSTVDNLTVTYGAAVTAIRTSTLANYTFGGFYVDSDCTKQLFDGDGKIVTLEGYYKDGAWAYAGDVTVYAKWTAN